MASAAADKPGFIGSIVSEWETATGKVLILANLIPAVGLLFFGWSVYAVVFLYWAENVVIGVFQALKMLLAPGPSFLKAFLVPFFCVHYGGFCFGHGIFVAALFSGALRGGKAPLSLRMPDDVFPALVAIIAAHAFFFVKNYLIDDDRASASPITLMSEPYGRIVLLHVFILGSAFLMMALRFPPQVLLVVILLKTAWDCRGEARRRALPPVPSPVPAA